MATHAPVAGTSSVLSAALAPVIWLTRRLRWHGRLTLVLVLVLCIMLLELLPEPLGSVGRLACGVFVIVWLMALQVTLVQQLAQLQQSAHQTTDGDLTTNTQIAGQDEAAQVGVQMNQMNQRLSAMVANIRSNTALVAHSGTILAESNHDLSQRTEQQAASLEQTAASVQQLSAAVQQTAQTAQEVSQLTRRVRKTTEDGHTAMDTAVQSMSGIQEGSRKVQDIVGVIDGIAFQTNILALNAAVEAARAGDQGRGFAVVASEVRTLAKRSSDAAKEIRSLIAHSAERVSVGEERLASTSKMLDEVLGGIREVAGKIESISTAASEQSANLRQVSQAIDHLDGITQQNAKMVDVATETSVGLQDRAGKLGQAVANFKLRQATADEAMAIVDRGMEHMRQRPGKSGLDALTDPKGPFIDRDLYVFVLDHHGRYHAFGGQPAKVGTRIQDVNGVDGADIIQRFSERVALGGGWVEYEFRNPTSGQVAPKMSFVLPLGEDLILGAGVYKEFVG